MTETIYKEITLQELKDFINEHLRTKNGSRRRYKTNSHVWFVTNGYNNVWENILQKTYKLPKIASFVLRISVIQNGFPICTNCEKEHTWINSIGTGFNQTCSKTCGDLLKVMKMQKASLRDYGVTNISKSKIIKERKIKTCLKNHGVSHPMQAETVRNKSKVTCNANYGVDYSSQSPIIKNAKVKTNIKNFGAEHPMHLEWFRERTKQTLIAKYGVINPGQLNSTKVKGRQTKENNGNMIPLEDLEPFALYSRLARISTEKQPLYLLENYDKPRGVGRKDNNNYHLDHIKSVKRCFIDGDSVEFCASLGNLRFIPWLENIKKGWK